MTPFSIKNMGLCKFFLAPFTNVVYGSGVRKTLLKINQHQKRKVEQMVKYTFLFYTFSDLTSSLLLLRKKNILVFCLGNHSAKPIFFCQITDRVCVLDQSSLYFQEKLSLLNRSS